MNRMTLLVAGSALSLAACLHDPGKPAKAWYGLAQAACGPADGPAVAIVIDTLPYAACTSSHVGQVRYYGGYVSFDSLRVGFTDSVRIMRACDDCAVPDSSEETFWLQVVGADPAGILVDFRHSRIGGSTTPVSESGRVLLKTCRERSGLFCG